MWLYSKQYNSSYVYFVFSYLTIEDEMQISRMPIPADDCADSEMSVDANSTDSKSNIESSTKVNGDSHTKLNGSSVDDSNESVEASEVVIKIKKEKDDEEEKVVIKTEPLLNNSDEPINNGEPIEQEQENVEKTVTEEIPTVDIDKTTDEPKENENKNEITPMEIDKTEEQLNDVVIIKKEVEEPEVINDLKPSIQVETENLDNDETNQSDEVIKNGEKETSSVNGQASDNEKIIKTEKVSPKVPEEEDISSEVSADTLSPKQVFTYIMLKCHTR